MRPTINLFLIGSMFLSVVRAQDVPAPPRPKEDGPSLAETMRFIQEKLADAGSVNFITFAHDNVKGNDWAFSRTTAATNFRADPAACRIDYHWLVKRNDSTEEDKDAWFMLKAVREIVLIPLDQRFKQIDAQAGHPEISARVDPPVFVVWVKRSDGSNEINLYDEALANRVAKALTHAVELCGGGNKDPF
jgi:hypothetical protein